MRQTIYLLLLGLGLVLIRPQMANANEWAQAIEFAQTGQTEAALPLQERLVSANPNNKEYRFELALALYRLGKNFRAKWHLEQVRGANLTPNERALVERFLADIAARSVWSGTFSIAFKPGSNAARKTEAETVNIGGLEFQLNADSRAKPGTSVLLTSGLGFSPRLTDRIKASFAVQTNVRFNEDRSLRDDQGTVRAGLSYAANDGSNYSGGLYFGRRWLAATPYSSATGLWADYSRLIGPQGRLDLSWDISNTSYRAALPDSQRHLVTAGFSHAIDGNARIGLSGFLESTRGSFSNLVGNRAAISVSGLYAWDGGFMTSLRFTHQIDRRKGADPIFGIVRHDEMTSLEVNLYHRNFRFESFAPTLALGIENNRSNLPLAVFDNRYISFGLTRDF